MHDSRRTRLVLSVFLIAALALITLDYRDSNAGPLRALSGFGNTVFGPVENLASDVFRPAAQLADGVKGAPSANAKISALQRQNAALRAELSQAQLDKADSAQLRQLLQLAGRGGYTIRAANVVAVSPGYESTVTLDVGSKDGITTNETVLNGTGLIGRVASVGPDTCTVVLAIDGSSHVGVRLASNGQIGEITGLGKGLSGPGTLQLTLLAANANLQVGQQLVTYGSVGDSPYVPGVPVGTIIKLEGSPNSLTTMALVRPFVGFTSLGVVGVVVAPPRANPRNSVLPPAPHATPTPTVTVTVRPKQSAGGSPGTTPTPGTGG
ncbi:MAG TPA: rod shape-determining protein MreC [Streptosporangiaceae bacterium]